MLDRGPACHGRQTRQSHGLITLPDEMSASMSSKGGRYPQGGLGEGVAVRYHLRVHVDRFRAVVQFESEKMNVIIQGLALDGGILG